MTLQDLISIIERNKKTINHANACINECRGDIALAIKKYAEENGLDILHKLVLFDPTRDGVFKESRAKFAIVTGIEYDEATNDIAFEITEVDTNVGPREMYPNSDLYPSSLIRKVKLEELA